tara:strand:+ start:574 stop:741 length:168 start_codon:yes stop_codon:yes gene_type:complete
MPLTPGTSTKVTISPAIRLASSDTWNPFVGIEAGRTYAATTDKAAVAQTKAKKGD